MWSPLVFGRGLAGIWSGLSTFMVLRLVFVGWRAFAAGWAARARQLGGPAGDGVFIVAAEVMAGRVVALLRNADARVKSVVVSRPASLVDR